jgi:molecular chaperone GrpE
MERAEGSNTQVADSATESSNSATESERLRAEVRREHDMYLRALADFENFRRRVERDRVRTAASGRRDILLSLLDVLDGFDRALPYLADAPPAAAEGVRVIQRRLEDLLNGQQVTPLKAVGEPFDPALHEAIGSVDNGDYPPGTVAEQVQRGYRMGDEVLRPARVRVAR